jgi:hypothetical protein
VLWISRFAFLEAKKSGKVQTFIKKGWDRWRCCLATMLSLPQRRFIPSATPKRVFLPRRFYSFGDP